MSEAGALRKARRRSLSLLFQEKRHLRLMIREEKEALYSPFFHRGGSQGRRF